MKGSSLSKVAVLTAMAVVVTLFETCPNVAFGETRQERVRSLVMQNFIHGFPADAALEIAELGPAAYPILAPMLADTTYKPYWGNIVLAIGYSGSPAAFQVLRGFARDRFHGEVDLETFLALGTVPTALGILPANDSTAALEYLETGAKPSTWANLPWSYAPLAAGDKLSFYFSKLCIGGLGYSESPVATGILARLAANPPDPRQSLSLKSAQRRNQEIIAKTRLGYIRAHQLEDAK
jgi:hypothetical protein